MFSSPESGMKSSSLQFQPISVLLAPGTESSLTDLKVAVVICRTSCCGVLDTFGDCCVL